MPVTASRDTAPSDIWLTQEAAAPSRDGIACMERLLWAAARQVQSASQREEDRLAQKEWMNAWLKLLERYEQACRGAFPRQVRPSRRASAQLSLIAPPGAEGVSA